MNLNIEYLHRNIKTIVDENKKYDVVVALELLEHVNNLSNFCELLGRCVHSKGLIILSYGSIIIDTIYSIHSSPRFSSAQT